MSRLLHFVISVLLISLFLCSCSSDVKEIENLNYATALGVDYKDGKYHLFVQLIGLSSVASTEGQSVPAQTFVSETVGNTFIDAFFEIYKSGQQKFIWSHIRTILLSKTILEEGVENILDGISRYYEFRTTPWVFVTEDPLEDVLATHGLFDQSSLDTILINKEQLFEQNSIVRPIQLHQFGRELFEPAFTTYVPSITIDKKQWKKNKEEEQKLSLNGAAFIQNKQFKGMYKLHEIKGLRWIVPGTIRASVLVPSDEDTELLVVLDHVKTKIMLDEKQKKFNLVMTGEGNIGNEASSQHLKTMEENTNDTIAKEIFELFQLGIENNTDFFNFEHIVYKRKNKEWKNNKNTNFLNEDLLNDVDVRVKILHSGAYKNKQVQGNE